MLYVDVDVDVNVIYSLPKVVPVASDWVIPDEQEMSKNYSISDLAAEFDISTRTIRFYEEKHLLNPRRVGTMREYAAAERIKLMLILRGKRLGFSLQESRDIIDLYNPVEGNMKQLQRLMERITTKQAELLQKRKEINRMLADLKQVKESCEIAIENKNW